MTSDLIGQEVIVYRNLNKNCWSVKSASGPSKGRVIAWVDNIALERCTFVVSAGGRARVLREQRKNVHAGVRGTVVSGIARTNDRLSYNPYLSGTFTVNELPAPPSVDFVIFDERGKAFIGAR
jgi:hypothetical protein